MIETIFWVLFWILIWPAGAWAIDRLLNPRTPERRAARLLDWYPRSWRARHGEDMGALLEDAVADGRDGPRLTLDVAREGLTERRRAFRWQQAEAGFLVGLGWTMFFPQGVVAVILLQFDVPPSWFLALHVDGEASYLVAGAMAGIGLLLVDRGMRIGARRCRPATA